MMSEKGVKIIAKLMGPRGNASHLRALDPDPTSQVGNVKMLMLDHEYRRRIFPLKVGACGSLSWSCRQLSPEKTDHPVIVWLSAAPTEGDIHHRFQWLAPVWYGSELSDQ